MVRGAAFLLLVLLCNCVALKKHLRDRQIFLQKNKRGASTYLSKRLKQNPTTRTITVKKGDTLYGISQKHGVPIRDIIQNNHLKPPFALSQGRRLILSQTRSHRVQKGDTLYSIARRHGVDVSALAHLNHLKAPFTLKIGQTLKLPGQINSEDGGDMLPTKRRKPFKDPKRRYARPDARASSTFLRPVQGSVLSPYGPLKNGTQNDGVNLCAKAGTPVKAAENGVVVYCGNDIPSYGNLVLVKHSGGWVSTYGHLKDISVKRGTKIKRGTTLGSVGMTGHVTQPQLHFELRKGRYPVNPMPYVSG